MSLATTRRNFLLRSAACSTLGATAPWALNLAAISSASAQTSASDYRALVCVFLVGGNDNHNTIIPLDKATYDKYALIRGSIAVPQADLALTELRPTTPWTDGRRMALHPQLSPLKPIFDSGQMALVMNVGTLIRPISLEEYSRQQDLPPRLFAHNDQMATWQVGDPDSPIGWGGRMADLLSSGNGEASTFTAVTTSGGLFLTGNTAAAYKIGNNGATELQSVYGSATSTAALRRLMQSASPQQLFEQTHAAISRSSFNAASAANRAIGAVALKTAFQNSSNTPLGRQLKVVAKLIAGRASLGGSGPRRQVFMVTQGGWDMHDNLKNSHPAALAQLANGLAEFHAEMEQQGLSGNVTSFTASDFGRTLSNNGDGSDHGWGGYHFVLGGAVRGGDWVGQLPDVAVGGRHDVGRGRLLPNISVDQYSATLARWLGVAAGDLGYVVPRIGNYSVRNLGFMKA